MTEQDFAKMTKKLLVIEMLPAELLSRLLRLRQPQRLPFVNLLPLFSWASSVW